MSGGGEGIEPAATLVHGLVSTISRGLFVIAFVLMSTENVPAFWSAVVRVAAVLAVGVHVIVFAPYARAVRGRRSSWPPRRWARALRAVAPEVAGLVVAVFVFAPTVTAAAFSVWWTLFAVVLDLTVVSLLWRPARVGALGAAITLLTSLAIAVGAVPPSAHPAQFAAGLGAALAVSGYVWTAKAFASGLHTG